MDGQRNIPEYLYPAWTYFRFERAVLRHRLVEEVEKFWKVFPRQRRRIMPTIGFSKKIPWFEPEPVMNLPWNDELGLVLRWRLSGVFRVEGKLKAFWEYEWGNKRPPPAAMLRSGNIGDPADQENYRYFWENIRTLHEQYLWLGTWFEEMAKLANEHDTRLATMVEFGPDALWSREYKSLLVAIQPHQLSNARR